MIAACSGDDREVLIAFPTWSFRSFGQRNIPISVTKFRSLGFALWNIILHPQSPVQFLKLISAALPPHRFVPE